MYKLSKNLASYSILTGIIMAVIVILSNYHPYTDVNLFGPDGYVIKFNFSRTVDVNTKNIFNVMKDVKNYPNVMPNSVIYIKIINQTENTTFAEEQVSESEITTTLLVKHTFTPYEKQTIEVVRGDAHGTLIAETFDEINPSSTKLTTNVEMHLYGILEPFGFLARSNLEHAMNTVIDDFVTYAESH